MKITYRGADTAAAFKADTLLALDAFYQHVKTRKNIVNGKKEIARAEAEAEGVRMARTWLASIEIEPTTPAPRKRTRKSDVSGVTTTEV